MTTPPVPPTVTTALRVEVDTTRTTSNGGITTLSFRVVNDTDAQTWRTTSVALVLPDGTRLGHFYAGMPCDGRAGTVSCQISETLAPGEAGTTYTLDVRNLNGDRSPVTDSIAFTVDGVLVA